jgi:hypothetical protein
LALGDVQEGGTGSYPDRGERREVRAWAPRSVKRFPFQGTSDHDVLANPRSAARCLTHVSDLAARDQAERESSDHAS